MSVVVYDPVDGSESTRELTAEELADTEARRLAYERDVAAQDADRAANDNDSSTLRQVIQTLLSQATTLEDSTVALTTMQLRRTIADDKRVLARLIQRLARAKLL